jgi:hypothetical protein
MYGRTVAAYLVSGYEKIRIKGWQLAADSVI